MTRSRRRGDLSLDEVVEVTRRIIRREGLDKVSMRGVARELGVATMATYTYVANKDELLGLVHQAVEQEWEPLVLADDGWEAGLRRFLMTQWQTYRKYPGLAAWKMSESHFGSTPESYRTWVQFFVDAGFGEREAILAWSFAETYMMGRLAVDARMAHGSSKQGGGLPARDYVGHGIEGVIAGIRETLAPRDDGTAVSSSSRRPPRATR